MAQRLVRIICEHCRTEYKPEHKEIRPRLSRRCRDEVFPRHWLPTLSADWVSRPKRLVRTPSDFRSHSRSSRDSPKLKRDQAASPQGRHDHLAQRRLAESHVRHHHRSGNQPSHQIREGFSQDRSPWKGKSKLRLTSSKVIARRPNRFVWQRAMLKPAPYPSSSRRRGSILKKSRALNQRHGRFSERGYEYGEELVADASGSFLREQALRE